MSLTEPAAGSAALAKPGRAATETAAAPRNRRRLIFLIECICGCDGSMSDGVLQFNAKQETGHQRGKVEPSAVVNHPLLTSSRNEKVCSAVIVRGVGHACFCSNKVTAQFREKWPGASGL